MVDRDDPGPVMTFTLDTSSVSAAANSKPSEDAAEAAAMNALRDLAKAGRVRLQLTAAYYRDFERWGDDAGRARLHSQEGSRASAIATSISIADRRWLSGPAACT